jgi:YfiH family protein
VPTSKTLLRKAKQTGKRVTAPSVKDWNLQSAANGLSVLQVAPFNKFTWLVHGFSTSRGGVSSVNDQRVLNLGFTEWDKSENVRENRRLFQSALGAADLQLAPLKQFHSDVICDFSSAPVETCSADASISNEPKLLLGIQTADCVPVLLVDPVKRAVAAIHAGWRGTLKRIVEKTIGRMEMQYATQPKNVLAAIGPSIGGCCYEVGTEVAAAFQSQFKDAPDWFDELHTGDEPNPLQWLNQFPPGHQPPPKNVRLDLKKANRAQLLAAGVEAKNIYMSDLCTACRPDLLFSYRKDGSASGRMLSVIGIRGK